METSFGSSRLNPMLALSMNAKYGIAAREISAPATNSEPTP
jgi:hypothetical protein